jgi:hypothetical protein
MKPSSSMNWLMICRVCLLLLFVASQGCVPAPASLPSATKLPAMTTPVVVETEPGEIILPASQVTSSPSSTALLPVKDISRTKTPVEVSSNQSDRVLATPSSDLVREMMAQVDLERALNDLKQFTGDIPICTEQGCYSIINRMTGSVGLQWAKDYVAQELARLGYEVEMREWSREGLSDQNLLAVKRGTIFPEQEIYIVAHLDGVELEGNVRAPAADDNASGAVDLLELGRILSGYSLSRTLVLFFSTGEEEGTLGVESYLDQLSAQELDTIEGVINLDMVGYDGNGDRVMELWSGDHPPSLALTEVMSKTIASYGLDLDPRFVTGCD